MKIIDRYILGKYLGSLAATLVSFSLIVFVVDFVERGWRIMQRYDSTIGVMAVYYINYMPFYIILAFPVAMLVSVLFSVGSLAKNHELDILKASGLSLYRIASPILITAFFLSIGVMVFGEFVLTGCERRKDDIMEYQIKKNQVVSRITRQNIKVTGKGDWIILGEKYDVESRIASKVKVYRISDNKIVKNYSAEKLIPSDSGWVLINGVGQEFSSNVKDSTEHFIKFDTLWAPFLTQTPDMMAEMQIPPRQMTFFDLLRRIGQKRILGEPFKKEQVELYLKITFPFAGFILVLIGAPLASNPRRSGPSVGFGISIIISFIFFVLVRIGQSLGNNGKISPLLAASIGNIVFLAVGLFLLIRARK